MRNLKQKLPLILGTLVIIAFLSLGVFNIVSSHKAVHLRDIQINTMSTQRKQLESNYQQLNVEFDKAKADKSTTQQQLQEKQKALDDAQQKINDLNSQLQAKAEAKQAAADKIAAASRLSIGTASAAAAPVATTGGCQTGYSSGDYYLDKIISYESSGNSCATNPGGCFGLLQACPGQPLRAACGGDPGCQIAWFQANKTGGRSWAQVWQHELDYGWW